MNKEFLGKLSLLYVEDQEEIRNFTSDILKNFVKNIFTAKNGLEGLEIFKNEKENIDIIITDINMPKLDGLSMIKEIKNINQDIPIIITTAHTDQEFLKKSIMLDVNSYTLKPIDLYDLINNIIKSLEIEFLKKDLQQENSINELLEKQDSLIAVFKEDNIEFSNSKFKKLFNEDFKFEDFVQDNIYFSKNKVPENTNWYEYINELKELDRVAKIVLDDIVYTFKLDTITLDKKENKFILSLFDVTKLYEKSNLLDYKSTHCITTGLYNKNKFHKLYNMEAKRARRYRKELSFIVFEFTNDFYTHNSLFDKLLVLISNEVSDNIREHDILFRWGNSSFLVILPETDLDGALNVAYKLEDNLNQLVKKNKFTNKFSFGITSLSSEDNEEDIIGRLQKALETSKKEETKVNYF